MSNTNSYDASCCCFRMLYYTLYIIYYMPSTTKINHEIRIHDPIMNQSAWRPDPAGNALPVLPQQVEDEATDDTYGSTYWWSQGFNPVFFGGMKENNLFQYGLFGVNSCLNNGKAVSTLGMKSLRLGKCCITMGDRCYVGWWGMVMCSFWFFWYQMFGAKLSKMDRV